MTSGALLAMPALMSRLTVEEERGFFEQWCSRGEGRARDAILEAHLWLVAVVSREYRCSATDRADLIGEGHLGLLLAFDRFDRTLGVRFATYARYWVQAAMSAYLLKTSNALGSLARSRADVRRRRESAASRNFGLEGYANTRDVSLDAPLASNDEATLLDRLPAESTDVDARIECARRDDVIAGIVADLVATFDRRERIIYESRFAEDEASSNRLGLEAVACRLQLSRERVRQLEERVRRKLASSLRPVYVP